MEEKIPSTISYSAMTMFNDCPRLYYINYILGLYKFDDSPDTIFGSVIHKYCQGIISDTYQTEDAVKLYLRTWKKFVGIYGKYIDEDKYNLVKLEKVGQRILENIKEKFVNQFGKFKVIQIEKKLNSKLENYPQRFKGYIDIVIQLEDGKYIILDFKTTNSFFIFRKYKDALKDYQLTLYKNFYCKEENIDLKLVETYFCLLEKNIKSKTIIEFDRITSGNKKISNALNFMDSCLKKINNMVNMKNKAFCFKYKNNPCQFRNTEYCQ